MLNHNPKLTDREVLDHAREGLKPYLPLQAEGYKCSTDDLYNLLLGAAANCTTMEALCNDLQGVNAETVRGYLKPYLRQENLPGLEQAINQALADQIPLAVSKHLQEVAIDLHDRPYYGKQAQESGQWVQGQLRHSTHRFYRVATAYLIRRGLRVNLAVHFVLPDEGLCQVLSTIMARLQTLSITLSVLYLDKGFAGIEILNYLTDLNIKAVIACSIRGKKGGTKALCTGRRSYTTAYTFHGRGGTSYTAQLAICRVFTTHRRKGRMKRRVEWLIYILIGLDYGPRQTKRQYRRRFGVETSYRCAGQVRGWTTSPNPVYRFLLIGLSFYLVNVWVHLRWLYTQVAHRGRRKLKVELLPLTRLAKFIVRALEQRYDYVHEIVAPSPPLP